MLGRATTICSPYEARPNSRSINVMLKLSNNKVKAQLFNIDDASVRDFDKSGECLPAGLMASSDKNSFQIFRQFVCGLEATLNKQQDSKLHSSADSVPKDGLKARVFLNKQAAHLWGMGMKVAVVFVSSTAFSGDSARKPAIQMLGDPNAPTYCIVHRPTDTDHFETVVSKSSGSNIFRFHEEENTQKRRALLMSILALFNKLRAESKKKSATNPVEQKSSSLHNIAAPSNKARLPAPKPPTGGVSGGAPANVPPQPKPASYSSVAAGPGNKNGGNNVATGKHSGRIIVSARGSSANNGNGTTAARAEISATPKSGSGSRAGAKGKAEFTVLISGNKKMSVDKLESMCSRFGFALGDDYEYSLPVGRKDKHCKLSFKTKVEFENFVASFNKFHQDLEADEASEEQNLLPVLNRFAINGSINGNVFRYTCRPEEARDFDPIKELVRLRLISKREAEQSAYRCFLSGEGFIYLPDYKVANSAHFTRLTEINELVRSGFISLTQPLLGVFCPDLDSRTYESSDSAYAHRSYGASPPRSGILRPMREQHIAERGSNMRPSSYRPRDEQRRR